MRRRTIIFTTVILAIITSIALTFLGRGTFDHAIMVMSATLWIGAPALILTPILLFIGRFKTPNLTGWAAAVTISIFLFILIQWPSIYIGRLVQSYHLTETKKYLEALSPKIDAYRAEKNEYPKNLNQLNLNPEKAPMLLRVTRVTLAEFEPNNFQVIISDPLEFGIYGFIYSGNDKTWTYFYD